MSQKKLAGIQWCLLPLRYISRYHQPESCVLQGVSTDESANFQLIVVQHIGRYIG